MADIQKVLITLELTTEQLQKLKNRLPSADVIHIPTNKSADIITALRTVDVAFIAGDITPAYLQAPNLKWLHCDHAGLDRSAAPAVFKKNLILTSSSGRSSEAIAEHVLYFMLAFTFKKFTDAQSRQQWGVAGQNELRALKGSTVGIAGLGNNGRSVARLARTLGMRVLGYRRSDTPCDFVDELYPAGMDNWHRFLSVCDCVVLTLPLNDDTHQLMDAAALAVMKKTASLINVGRGDLIDEAALKNALNMGWFSGVGLDVFSTEPLPANHAFWNMPKVLITPHFTPPLVDRKQRSLNTIEHNIKAYHQGLPMQNQLQLEDRYSHAISAELNWTKARVKAAVTELMRRLRLSLSVLYRGY